MKKKWKWILIIMIVVILTVFCYFRIRGRRVEFLEQYYGNPEAARYEIRFSDYYSLDWLKSAALTRAESDGKEKAISPKNCRGYKQLESETAAILKKSYPWKHELEGISSPKWIYNTKFNIWGGCSFLKTLLDVYADGDYFRAVEMYNLGPGNTRKGMTANTHLKKWAIEYVNMKTAWKWHCLKRLYIF